MSEERRPRRGRPRVGDETQARIDDLAEGWHKPERRSPPPPSPSTASASEGSAEKRQSRPPPLPAARPPAPPSPRAAGSRPMAADVEANSRPLFRLPDLAGGSPPPAPIPKPASAAPSKPASAAPSKPSAAPSKPSAASPSRPVPAARSEPAAAPSRPIVASRSEPSLRDEDATLVPTGDEAENRSMPLPRPPALPRRAGLWGDMRYVLTVPFGLRRLRQDIEDTELEIEAEKRARDKQMIELARLAIADESIVTADVEKARDQLIELEAVRSKKVGAAAAVEEAISSLARERDKVRSQRETEIAELESNIADISSELEPLERKRHSVQRRIRDFKDQLASFDDRIADDEARCAAAEPEARAEIEAALASLRAERETLTADEPELAAALAEIEPPIRELKARRGELTRQVGRLRRKEDDSVVRSEERIAAARAHKIVVDRAAADMSREQNELLRGFGETLYRRPPVALAKLITPLRDRTDQLAELKAKALSLKDQRASVERWPLVRGTLLWLIALAALGAIAWFGLQL